MNLRVKKSDVGGRVMAIPSKSDLHRLLISAALHGSKTTIKNVSELCEDIRATIACLESLGCKINYAEGVLSLESCEKINEKAELNCRESGSTLRFMLPAAMALCSEANFTGCGRLPDRPLGELLEVMRAHSVSFSSDRLPLSAKGRLSSGEYRISGNISSQYISGLMFALSVVGGEIHLTTELQSADYVNMTIASLRRFGVDISEVEQGYIVKKAAGKSGALQLCADGDWSNAAFFLCLGAIGQRPISVKGLDICSRQGDSAIVEILKKFGARIAIEADEVTVFPSRLKAISLDISQIPDLLPILAVTAAFAQGESEFYNAARLRLKESDRLLAVETLICSLSGKARAFSDSIRICGGGLAGGTADSFADHRIVMSAAVAGCVCEDSVLIKGAEAVNKSYVGFFDSLASIGGSIHRE